MLDLLLPLVVAVADPVLVGASDQAPEPEDVKAGWTALVIFVLLILAVVVLAFSLVKQLRKAQAARDAGVYGDEPARAEELDEPGAEPGEQRGEHPGEDAGPRPRT